MARATQISASELNDALVAIASMSREELIEQLHAYPAPFPVDFTDQFLRTQSLDHLRHVFAGLVMHCRIAPRLHRAA